MKTKSIDEALQTLQQIERESRDFMAPARKLSDNMKDEDLKERWD